MFSVSAICHQFSGIILYISVSLLLLNLEHNRVTCINVSLAIASNTTTEKIATTSVTTISTIKPLAHLKYILLWVPPRYAISQQLPPPFGYFGKKQIAFIQNNCVSINCYVTTNANLFGNVSMFDAIVFNGNYLPKMTPHDLPKKRLPFQKYIYMSQEAPDDNPVCSPIYDNFFNWTETYRLDSDIPLHYFAIKNSFGEVVGPRSTMRWPEKMEMSDSDLWQSVQNKTRAVAWFASNCAARVARDVLVGALDAALARRGLAVDVFGYCGPLACRDGLSPRLLNPECDKMLAKDYYFFLALENSFAPDYVTLNVVRALRHTVVPIVYGGADYTRFLPPGSYVDALQYSVHDLAALIADSTRSLKRYLRFFSWRDHFTFHDRRPRDNVCALCNALNDDKLLLSETVYHHFRYWWNPHHEKMCGTSPYLVYLH